MVQEPIGQETPIETPTAEDRIKTLESELNKTKQELESTTKGLRTAHQTLTQKDLALKRQSDLRGEIDELKETQKLYLAFLAEQSKQSEDDLTGTLQSRKPDLLKSIAAIEAESKVKRQKEQAEVQRQEQIAEFQAQIDTYKERVEKTGLTENDEAYWEIHGLVTEGKFKLADIILKKLEGTKEKNVAKNETEDQRIERRAQEILREKGLLKAETPVPSGSNRTFTAQQIEAMSDTEFLKNKVDIEDAMRAGRIK